VIHLRRAIRVAGIACLLAAVGVQAATVPFERPARATDLEEPEQRVWGEAEDVDLALSRSGQLLRDDEVEAWLAGLMLRLFPDFGAALRVRIVRDPEMNAFCLPNGSIYMNLGMLARVRNSAQLATILAHEGVHFTHRHGYQQRSSLVTTAGFTQGAGIAGGLVGALLGSLVGMSSIRGFSRTHEREADRVGFGRLLAGGFDPRESVAVFEMLTAESKAMGLADTVFFASHPQLDERIRTFRELGAMAVPPAMPGSDAALRAFQPRLQREWMALEASMGQGGRLVHQLTRPDAADFYPPEAPYYLGEGYRLRGDAADRTAMIAAYESAVRRAPTFAPAYAALGVVHFKAKDCARAAPHLRTYLDLAPDGPLRGHVGRMLEKCR
jgi:beta-barrel assembly-enhancing protease